MDEDEDDGDDFNYMVYKFYINITYLHRERNKVCV